jgi:hypothetical protein
MEEKFLKMTISPNKKEFWVYLTCARVNEPLHTKIARYYFKAILKPTFSTWSHILFNEWLVTNPKPKLKHKILDNWILNINTNTTDETSVNNSIQSYNNFGSFSCTLYFNSMKQ